MPGKERTRRPGADQLDLTSLLDADANTDPADEPEAQQRLLEAAATLESTMKDSEERAWEGSPYAWIRHLPAGRKSRVAERLVATYLAGCGTVVGSAKGPGHSFTVAERRIKVRLSLRWASGEFVFQQLESGEYDTLVLVGIEPRRIHTWVLTPDQLAGNLDSSTGWLSFRAAIPPAWLAQAGPGTHLLAERLR